MQKLEILRDLKVMPIFYIGEIITTEIENNYRITPVFQAIQNGQRILVKSAALRAPDKKYAQFHAYISTVGHGFRIAMLIFAFLYLRPIRELHN